MNAEEEALQRFDFRTYSLGAAVTDLYYFSAGEYKPLIVTNNQRSSQYQFEGGSRLGFFSRSTGPDGEDVYALEAFVDVDPRLRKVFVVFSPKVGTDGELVHRVYHVEDSFGTKSAHDWMVLNLTTKKLVTKIEADIAPFSLVPGKTHFVRPTPRNNKSYIFSVAEEVEGEWQVVYNSIWPHSPDKRAIVFILPRANDPKGIRLKRLYETIIPESAESQP